MSPTHCLNAVISVLCRLETKHDSIQEGLQHQLDAVPVAKRYVVALSGGLDSQVLLHALSQILPQNSICALYIDHGLQAQAKSWSSHCAALCCDLGVDFYSISVNVASAAGQGLEAAARDARYTAFAGFLRHDDLLLLGQHQRDQAETVMLRLLRGAGSLGLSAMPQQRSIGCAHMLRPLLSVSRKAIDAYAVLHKIDAIVDPSNSNQQFDRNYLRLQVMPMLRARWPALDAGLATVATLQRDNQSLLDDLAQIDAIDCDQRPEPWGVSVGLPMLLAMSERRQANLLRHICLSSGVGIAPRARLLDFLAQLKSAGDNASPMQQWSTGAFRRFANRVYILGQIPSPPEPRWYAVASSVDIETCIRWHASALPDSAYRLGFRAQQSSKRLKNRFQELGIAPWLRDHYPLLCQGGKIVAIGPYWLSGQPPIFTIDIEWRAIEQQ